MNLRTQPSVPTKPGGVVCKAEDLRMVQSDLTPYYSTIRYWAVRATNTYTVAANGSTPLQFFSYYMGSDMAQAGRPGVNGLLCETNLVADPFKPNPGHKVMIWGLTIQPSLRSNPEMLKSVMELSTLSIMVNGEAGVNLGKPLWFPPGVGLIGGGVDPTQQGSLVGAQNPVSYVTSGMPGLDNIYVWPKPILWDKDTDLRIASTLHRSFTMSTVSDVSAATGIKAFAAPADGAEGTYVDLICRLLAWVEKV